ncbi:MAG: radical SAM protein [Deltaproteobacteria bacterium]|nr:radical SAM protein [Deltaproteobacteria bacterium]
MTVLLANAPTRIPTENGLERYFVKAGSRWPFSLEKPVGEPPRYCPFPFGLGVLAGLLERASLPVEVLDGVALNLAESTFLERCVALRPRVILLEATTPTVVQDLAVCRELKARTGALIALAGTHPTVFARELLREEPAVSWVFRGEYELAALRAIQALLAGEDPEGAVVAATPGIVVGRGARGEEREVLEGPEPEPILDLDALPFPARHLFPTRQAPSMWPYWDGFCQRRPAVQLQSTRGCPWRCTFCLWIPVMYQQGPYRTRSPGRIVDEMEEVIGRYGAREIYFDDDTFTVREEHVLGLCSELERRGLKVPWSVMGDAMAVTERAIDAMARAGCIGMKFGLESANKEVLKATRKPVKTDKVRDVVGWCARRGIKTHATVTFGLEADTSESMAETLAYCCGLPVDSIQFSIATPFPGTELHARAERAGRIRATSWMDYDGARSTVLTFPGMLGEEVASFARRAPSAWLKSRLREPAWVRRQARYLAQTLADQGLPGLVRRVNRGLALFLSRPT